MKFKYIDVHCHPNLGELKVDQEAVIEKMREEGIAGIVVGVDLESSQEAVRLAEKHDNLWACIGLHPNYTQEKSFDEIEFETLVAHPRVVGIGECGLDYFRLSGQTEEENEKIKNKQWEELEKQVAFALKHSKPLMVHCRPSKNSMDAYEDFATYLENMGDAGRQSLKGNMHFFVGNLVVAKWFWALGFTTSFTGVLTFTDEYNEVVREAPLDMILTETDAPYASPVPHRGKRNEPAFVPLVAKAVARIRGEDEEKLGEAALANARRIFKIEA